MIRRQALIHARPIVSDLRWGNKLLEVRLTSPVYPLVASSIPRVEVEEDQPTGESGLNQMEELIRSISDSSIGTDVGDHTAMTSDVVNQLVTLTGNTISLVKNKVNPTISEILSLIEEAKGKVRLQGTAPDLIRTVGALPIYSDTYIKELAERGKRIKFDVPNNFLTDLLGAEFSITAAGFIDVCRTGLSTTDTRIVKMIEGNWEQIESIFWNEGHLNTMTNDTTANPFVNHTQLAMLLFLNGVRNGRLDSVEVSSLSGSTLSMLINIIANLSLFVKASMAFIERNSKSILINPTGGFGSSGDSIYVNSANYRKWLEDYKDHGASADVIVQAKKQGYSDVRLKDADAVKLLAAEAKSVENHRARTEAARIQNAVHNVIQMYISRECHDQFESGDARAAVKELKEFLRKRPVTSTTDLPAYLRDIVIEILFDGDVDTLDVLIEMNEEFKQDPEISPQVAGFNAFVRLLCRWFVEQCEIKEGTESPSEVTPD